MKVVAYVRVSTDAQVDGLGLDIQQVQIRKWSKANGHKVVGVEADEGKSGSDGLESRDALASAMRRLRSGEAAGLVVYRLDRLARDLVLQESLLAEVRRHGAEVFTTSPSEAAFLADDPDDPSRRLIRQVLGAVAEYERGLIKLRLASGRRRKCERGGYAYGAPPYGYRSEAGVLVPDPIEHPALVRMLDLHKSGGSLNAIIATLDAEGHRPKRGGRWHTSSVWRIIQRANDSTPIEGVAT